MPEEITDPEFWPDLFRTELSDLLAIPPEERTEEEQGQVVWLVAELEGKHHD